MKGVTSERAHLRGFPAPSLPQFLTIHGKLLLTILLCCSSWAPRASCQNDIIYSLQEEEAENTFVANILLDAELEMKYDPEDLAKLEFILNERRGTKRGFRDFFHIETKSGILRTAKVIDRDAICPHEPTCPIPLNIMVQPGQYFQIIKITINVIDKNDNRPIFPQSDMSLSISETTAPGSKFALPRAEDDDSGTYSVQRYHLVSGSDAFGLQVTNSSFGGMDIHLVVKEKLDREAADSYQMEVVAMDGGVPPKSGVMRLSVSVIDANDNNPMFDNYTYEVNVPENFPPGKTILKLHASDPDSGANGQIFYRLAENTLNMYGDMFGVDAHTGELYLKSALDFEKTQTYSLTVTARDQGPNSLPAYAKVILRVEDVNDHTPTITVNALTASGLVEVSEDAPIGTFVAHVSVVDNDAGPSGDIQCQMKSGQFELQQLYQTEFKIVTAALFDRERQDVYRLNLECKDNGQPPQNTVERIVVSVQDANDNAPTFSQQVYSVKMREGNAIGAFIVQVNATDADAGRNRILSYAIPEGADQGMVAIHPSTGVIRAHGSFDYEKEPIYEFPVIAIDRGDPARTGTAVLRVTVQDQNDEPPEFVRNSYSFEIEENRAAHSFVGVVSATDKDAHPYDVIKYSIDPFYGGLDAFRIDPDTGEITTVKILDREVQEMYELVVVATNEGYPQMRSTINTSIFVLDENDNDPELKFPSELNNMVHIANDLPIGKEVTRIDAFDPDEGDNAKLSYSCPRGNEEHYFVLNKTTGQLLVNKNLGSFDYYHFTLAVMVQDQGTPTHTVSGELHVIVNRSLAVIHFHKASGFSFLNIENHHLIVGTVVIVLLVVILIVVIIIVRCRQRQATQGNKYNCRREAKKRDAARKDANGEWKPVPNYAVEAAPNGPVEKPRKNVKFHVDKDDLKEEREGLWPPPPPQIHDVHDGKQRPNAVPKLKEASTKHLHSNGGVGFSPDSKSPLLSSPAKESMHPNSPDPAHFRGATNNRHGYPPLTQQELEELVTSAYQVLVVCRAQTPKPKNQMHEMLQLMPQDRDSESGSYTDSGRGPSEEGENAAAHPPHNPAAHAETQLVDNNKNYRPDGTGRQGSTDMGPTWPRSHNSGGGGGGGLGNLKSFTNPRPDKEIKYQNRIPSQPLDNRPVLKYSTFHHSSPAKQQHSVSGVSPAHKPSITDPIWLPRQHSSDSHGSSQSLSRTRGGSGGHIGLPGNCNNNNNSQGGSHSNSPSPSPQHQPFCRVGVSPSPTCESPGVREPLLPRDPDHTGRPGLDSTYVVGSKDSPSLKSNGTLIL